MLSKQQTLIAYSFRARKSQDEVQETWCLLRAYFLVPKLVFPLNPHITEEASEFLGVFFMRALTPTNLISSGSSPRCQHLEGQGCSL